MTKHLVLLGGGHTHVQVIKDLVMHPDEDIALTVVVDDPIAVYSGMVPGFVAGDYQRHELEIDVRPLVKRAKGKLIVAAAERVDANAKLVFLKNRTPLNYDVLSANIGATVAGLDLPGVRENAIPTRPISRFVDRFEPVIAEVKKTQREEEIVIVGGGIAGFEIAFCLRQRFKKENLPTPRVLVLERHGDILRGFPPSLADRVRTACKRETIRVETGITVNEIRDKKVWFNQGDSFSFDRLFWVTGAEAHPIFKNSKLSVTEKGFLKVKDTLQAMDDDSIFCAGDAAHMINFPNVPKAGVYAVRAGSILKRNLRAALKDKPLRTFKPQKDFLMLLNLGNHKAIGCKMGKSFEGGWVYRMKDSIDRKFMRKFQILEHKKALPPMEEKNMFCGGCAAKVGESILSRALKNFTQEPNDRVVIGIEKPDDVAATKTKNGETLLSTMDFFPDFVDDPYVLGQVAAQNAVSDLLVKGGIPEFAMALVVLEQDHPFRHERDLTELLEGAKKIFTEEGVSLVGGQTSLGHNLSIGFSMQGRMDNPESLMKKGGLNPGDKLILTKPLGTGVLFHADMKGEAKSHWIEEALRHMTHSNRTAAQIALQNSATAATDVTGFGLAGHLVEMLKASNTSVSLNLKKLPILPGTEECFANGLRSTTHEENAKIAKLIKGKTHPILYDPQTSGGVLFGIPAEKEKKVLEELKEKGNNQSITIGEVTEKTNNAITTVPGIF